MAKKLPQTIYVYWYDDDTPPFLIATEKLETTVRPGDKQLVGVYQLTKQGTVKSEVKLVTEL